VALQEGELENLPNAKGFVQFDLTALTLPSWKIQKCSMAGGMLSGQCLEEELVF
jgi:hypothetical protein